ncbi:MAG: hypothetical protein BAJALOKI3v1_30091 [Promethearchaeota archaeon]|jgi:hypothetical protein|nr:MAG: hypothetical protein BAJALOKI3v1_30091 [Candidatus Lokiarchaeota archaeon]
MDEIPPPICAICKKNFKDAVDKLYYCICDTAVCEDCINTVKTAQEYWECPKCGTKNKIEETRLFREKNI